MVNWLDRLIAYSLPGQTVRDRAVAPGGRPVEPPAAAEVPELEVVETRVVSPAAVPSVRPPPSPGRGHAHGEPAGEPPAPPSAGAGRPPEAAAAPLSIQSPAEVRARPEPPFAGEAPGPAGVRQPASVPRAEAAGPPDTDAPVHREVLVQRVLDWVAGTPPLPEPVHPPASADEGMPVPAFRRARPVPSVEPVARAADPDAKASPPPPVHGARPLNDTRSAVSVRRDPPAEAAIPAPREPVQVHIDSIALRIDAPRPEAQPPRPPAPPPPPRRPAAGPGPDRTAGRLARRYVRI